MTYCMWYAQVSGGTPPYTYQWSGVLTGTYSSVGGSVWSSGWLYLMVRDASTPQQSKNTEQFITADWEQGLACD